MRERPPPFTLSAAATAVEKFPSFLGPTPHQLISHVGNLAATHVGALLCSAPHSHSSGTQKLAVRGKRKVFESIVTTRGQITGEEGRKKGGREGGVREALFVLVELQLIFSDGEVDKSTQT